MTPAYAAQISFAVRSINVGVEKIDGSPLKTYEMTIATFSVQDKLGWNRFFKETFLLTDTSMEVVLGMLFLSLSNADIDFEVGGFT